MKTYNLFISHSWAYGDAYDRLIELLKSDWRFSFKDFSVPRYDPIHTRGTDKELQNAILNQMRPCHVMIILSGVYATYSKWINKEVQIAKTGFTAPKPILAIRPWAQERNSSVAQECADGICGWNTAPIIAKIRELAI